VKAFSLAINKTMQVLELSLYTAKA